MKTELHGDTSLEVGIHVIIADDAPELMQYNGALKRPLLGIIKNIRSTTSRHAADGICTARLATAGQKNLDRSRTPQHDRNHRRTTTRGYANAASEQPPWECIARKEDEKDSRTVDTSARVNRPTVTLTPTGAVEDGAVEPRLKDTTEFGSKYFKSQIYRHSLKQAKAARRHNVRQKQRDRDTWKRVLRMLEQATPANNDRYKRVVEVVTLPRGVAAVFEPSKEVAVLEIMQRTGCHLQMAAGYSFEGRSDAFTGIALQGTRAQNSTALQWLPGYINVFNLETAENRARLTRKDFRRTLQAEDSEDAADSGHWQVYEDESSSQTDADQEALKSTTVVRSVWAVDRVKKSMQQHRPNKRESPSLQTPLDFTAYVDDLTGMRRGAGASEGYSQPHDSSTRRRIDSVMQELVSLFTEPATSHLSTPVSIAHSMQFLAKHENFAAVRQIFKALDEENRPIGSLGLNALLSAAADAGDIHNFERLLVLMRRRAYTWTPGSLTWASLHNLVCQRMPDQADTVAMIMRDKGHLRDNQTLRKVIQNEVRDRLVAHIQSGGEIFSFLTAYDTRTQDTWQRPDFEWLGVGVLNRMLHVLVTFGRTKEAVRLLEHFRETAHEPLTTTTLNTLLSTTSHDFDAGSAVATLRLFRVGDAGAVMPDRITYQILFMVAWRKKYYNMLRVVWRYACVAGEVSYDMRRRMTGSLLAYSPVHGEDVGMSSAFKAWGAKFALNVARDLMPSTHRPYDTSPDGLLGDDEVRILELGCQNREENMSAQSTVRRQELVALMNNDLREAGSCKPVLTLPLVLEKAWQKDLRWQARGAGIPHKSDIDAGRQAFKHALLHGIKVPMRSGDFSKFREWEIPALSRQQVVLAVQEPHIQELNTVDELQNGEIGKQNCSNECNNGPTKVRIVRYDV